MGCYSQYHYNTASVKGQKLWDPIKTLEIINTDPAYQCITCVGDAPSQRRRCRNAIRMDNRKHIMEVMDEIVCLDPHSLAVASRLRTIIGPALCGRHQYQAKTVLGDWRRKIQQLEHQTAEQISLKPDMTRPRQEFMFDSPTMAHEEQMRILREFLSMMQKEGGDRHQQNREYQPRESKISDDPKEEESKDRRREEQQRERERESRREEKERRREEKLEEERLEEERLEKERLEKERLEKERLEKERLEKERLRKERLEEERLEAERKRREEQTASNERIRQKAQRIREEREREKRERKQQERAEWDRLWTTYQEQWKQFTASTTREGSFRDTIPWPVKSGSYRDVVASNVKEFLQNAVPVGSNMSQLMRKECQKWHPDRRSHLLRGFQLTETDQMMVNMICVVVTGLLDDSAGR